MPAPLAGSRILVVDDEPLVGLDLQITLTDAGAEVVVCADAAEAVSIVEQGSISAAILDKGVEPEHVAALRERLAARSIPILVYSGFRKSTGAPGLHLAKPAAPDAIIAAMVDMLQKPST